ncbi:MAG: hypothetical protein ACJ73S_00320 [Mycobacteriales bacterium]
MGAGTVRRDDPRLVVKSERRRRDRRGRGVVETPLRVTLTRSGELDPGARLFGGGETGVPLVYAASGRGRDDAELAYQQRSLCGARPRDHCGDRST